MWATAVVFSRGELIDPGTPQIRNDGLIEAYSLDPAHESIGILTGALDVETMRIENSGIIRADIAYRSDSEYFSPPMGARDQIHNLAGGLIEGRIETRLGDDIIINEGTIRGDLLMGEGNDRVDNLLGTIDGHVHLEGGNDWFSGGAGNDLALGEGGNDRIESGAGDDRLDGGAGADLLDGGSGAEVFVFAVLTDSSGYALRSDGTKFAPDTIDDFQSGVDRIDLSAIDAISSTTQDDSFTFIGDNSFSGHAGELRFEAVDDHLVIMGDVNGDGMADFQIMVDAPALQSGDFFL